MRKQRQERAERAVLAALARNRGELDASILTRLLALDARPAEYERANGFARRDVLRASATAAPTKLA